MLMAADLSVQLGMMPPSFVDRLHRLLERAQLPVVGPALGAVRYLELMRVDKKAEGGQIRFVVVDGLGRAAVRAAPDEMVAGVIERRCAVS